VLVEQVQQVLLIRVVLELIQYFTLLLLMAAVVVVRLTADKVLVSQAVQVVAVVTVALGLMQAVLELLIKVLQAV
jgi:uncharacterized membrane protein